jgi:hypothetical protein
MDGQTFEDVLAKIFGDFRNNALEHEEFQNAGY